MNQETRQFIFDNKDADVFVIALQSDRFPKVDMSLAIRQITGKQKIKSKVPLFYNTEDILYPVQLSLEQSSSQSTAIYKSTLCNGISLVDLTGGFGVDCYFMSQQFNHATYVERQEELCRLAHHNFKALNKDNIKVIHCETEVYLTTMEHVDWIFIDPARRSISGKKVVLLSDCEPDICSLYSLLLEKASQIMIKLSPMMDTSAAIQYLQNTSEIHIISVENECKEVLLILNQSAQNNRKVKTINFGKNNKNQVFEYKLEDELTAEATIATKVEKFLYEPNASIMKSGAFKLIGNKFKINKLHKNTHLYTSNEFIEEFPGRVFEVINQWGNSKKELKGLVENSPKANMSTRNYPIGAEELRKKLKIKDGGDIYLFACTLFDEQKIIIETIKPTDSKASKEV